MISVIRRDLTNYKAGNQKENITENEGDWDRFAAELTRRSDSNYPAYVKEMEVTEFSPTSEELLQIVKYWTTEVLKVEYLDHFLIGMHEGRDWKLYYLAIRRISRITELLGEEAVDQAIDEVYTEFGKIQDENLWNIFLFGTEEEKEAAHNELFGIREEQSDTKKQSEPELDELIDELEEHEKNKKNNWRRKKDQYEG